MVRLLDGQSPRTIADDLELLAGMLESDGVLPIPKRFGCCCPSSERSVEGAGEHDRRLVLQRLGRTNHNVHRAGQLMGLLC
jgi:hypothetical protein